MRTSRRSEASLRSVTSQSADFPHQPFSCSRAVHIDFHMGRGKFSGQSDIKKAGGLARQVLADTHLSPQVARLANWLVSHVLVRERDFDSALGAADRAVAFAPYDTFMLSSLAMVLVQISLPPSLRIAVATAKVPTDQWSSRIGRTKGRVG